MTREKITQVLIAAGVLGLAVLFMWEPVLALFNVYEHTPEYSHGYLVPMFALYLLFCKRHMWRERGKSGRWFGVMLSAVSVLIVLSAQWYNYALRPGGLGSEFLFGLALLILVVGMCLAFGGFSLLRRWAWPVGFMVFAIPIPLSVTDKVTLPMRHFVTVVAGGVMDAMFIPVVQEGNVLRLPNYTVGIVDACSGIRSLFIMLAMGGVLVSLNKLGWRKAVAVFALAPVIAVLQNVMRVLITGLTGNAGLKKFTEGVWHEGLGMMTFGVSVAIFTCVALFLESLRKKQPDSESSVEQSGSTPVKEDDDEKLRITDYNGVPGKSSKDIYQGHLGLRRSLTVLITVCLLFCAGIAGTNIVEHHYRVYRHDLAERLPLKELPAEIGGYYMFSKETLGEQARNMLTPSEEVIRGYRDENGRTYSLTVLYWEPFLTRSRPEGLRLPHPPDVCYSGGGWEKVPEYTDTLPVPGISGQKAELRIYRKRNDVQALLFWKTPYPDLGDIKENLKGRFTQIIKSWTDPPLNTGSQWTLMIATSVRNSPREAQESLVAFLDELTALMPEYGIPPQLKEELKND